MENKDVNVFLISYNRLSYLKKLVDWLEKADFQKIHIVDNASTYPPLLEYLKKSHHRIHYLKKNQGHLAVWECGKFDEILKRENYIVSDCDVLPTEECPKQIVGYFENILEKYPEFTKVGFGLKLDDLPEEYVFKRNVLEWEGKFWKKNLADGLFDASIDTTFALYRPGIFPGEKKWWKSIRTGAPYLARHLPWYEDSKNLLEEAVYYQNNLNSRDSFWSVVDLELLKKYNKALKQELTNVYASWRWKILRGAYSVLGDQKKRNKFAKKDFPIKDEGKIADWQKNNKDHLEELGKIYSSFGWRMWDKISRFDRKSK